MTAKQLLKRNAELRARKSALEEAAQLLADIHALESYSFFPDEGPSARALRVLMSSVATEFGIPVQTIMGRTRTFRAALGRHILCHLATKVGGLSYSELSRRLNRTHGAIMYACQRVTSDASVDRKFAALIERMESECAERLVVATTNQAEARHEN